MTVEDTTRLPCLRSVYPPVTMANRPLLMIPGPIEVSDGVSDAAAEAPRSHVAPDFVEAMGGSLQAMRHVWRAGEDAQPFILAGSGSLAMDMATWNVIEPGERVVVVNTGFFSDRSVEMLHRRGAHVTQVSAEPGDAPSIDAVARALDERPTAALFATHVDTSTGVRLDAEGLCRIARERNILTVFDGVCATGGERFEMDTWGADVYLTASQKAIGLPPGLALLVASPRALERRRALSVPPPMSLDWLEWLPVMTAYEARRPAYFATPATTLVWALRTGLDEILSADTDPGTAMDARVSAHAAVAGTFRAAWRDMGLELVPVSEALAANTLSAIRYPDGIGQELVSAIKERGVVVAPGLHPEFKDRYFRVGHMGDLITRPTDISRCIDAVRDAVQATRAEL